MGLGAGLLLVYVVLMLMPLLLAGMQDRAPRPVRDELASGMALVAFAMLLAEFVLSGRHKGLSGRIGMDSIMRFHQFMAHVLLAFILIHPFLYSLPMGVVAPLGDLDRETWLQLTTWPGITGLIAWLALFIVVLMAAVRDQLSWSYEAWRISHAVGALLVAVLGWHHTVWAGRYSGEPLLAGVWTIALAIAVIALIHVHWVTPLLQRRRPYRVAAVRQEADRTWTVDLEPDTDGGHSGARLEYKAGQFAWFKVGGPLGRITEHPFSMSSAPAQWPLVSFTIKEAGDFTDRIGQLPEGTQVYLDGPYGNFTLDADDNRPLIMLAGGVGMAPVMSLLRGLRDAGSKRRIVLFQANRHEGQILYADELADMANSLDLRVHQVLQEPPEGWSGERGFIDRRLLESTLPEDLRQAAQWAVCGPPAMIDALETLLLRDFRVHRSGILSEHFHYRFGDRAGKAGHFLRAALAATVGLLLGLILFALRG